MHRSMRPFFALALALSSLRCSPSPAPRDAATDAVVADIGTDVVARCNTDIDCSDGVFCNGVERCAPGLSSADARGCLPASPATPCLAGQMCSEAMRRCLTSCADADGDGHTDRSCGGDDCDDTDPHRFPGNAEVCAVVTGAGGTTLTRADGTHDPTHDEDCDATTVAGASSRDGDHDGDGFIDRACCNRDSSGGMHCGDDCADLAAVDGIPAAFMTHVDATNIHPSATESCDGVDSNCDGQIDEGLPRGTYYPDCDGDRYGDATATALGTACTPRQFSACNGHDAVTDNTDCDDAESRRHPGLPEVCGTVWDVGCMGADPFDRDGDHYDDRACGGTDCFDMDPALNPSTPETCNNADDNCNGLVDEGLAGCALVPCNDHGTATSMCDTSSGGCCCFEQTPLTTMVREHCQLTCACAFPTYGSATYQSSTCDGPEDCATGQVCCAGNAAAIGFRPSVCVAPGMCSGTVVVH